MSASAHLNLLLSVLRDREITIPESDIRPLFSSSADPKLRSQAIRWIHTHISPTTLLSREEAQLYEALRQGPPTGEEIKLTGSTPDRPYFDFESDFSEVTGFPLLHHEIASAIDALETAAASLDRQTRTLETQRNALLSLRAANMGSYPSPSASGHRASIVSGGPSRRSGSANLAARAAAAQTDKRRRIYAHEISELVSQIEDGAYAARSQIDLKRKQGRTMGASAAKQIEGRLKEDDNLLTTLGALQTQLLGERKRNSADGDGEDRAADEDVNVASLADLIEKIVALRTATENARVNTIYNAALAEYVPGKMSPVSEYSIEGFSSTTPSEGAETGADGQDDSSISQEKRLQSLRSAVEQELGNLYSEIPTVTDLAANTTLRQPLEQAVSHDAKSKFQRQNEGLEYILGSLGYMAENAAVAEEYVHRLWGFREVVERIGMEMPAHGQSGARGIPVAGSGSVDNIGSGSGNTGSNPQARASLLAKHPLTGAGFFSPSGATRTGSELFLHHFGIKLDRATVAALHNSAAGGALPPSLSPSTLPSPSTAAMTVTWSLSDDITMRKLKLAAHANKALSAYRSATGALDREEGEIAGLVAQVLGNGYEYRLKSRREGRKIRSAFVNGIGVDDGVDCDNDDDDDVDAILLGKNVLHGPGIVAAFEQLQQGVQLVNEKMTEVEKVDWWERVRDRVGAKIGI